MGKYDKPHIAVVYTPGTKQEYLDAVAAGIEEEGIPYSFSAVQEGTAAALAFEAADSSRLAVGIAIAKDGAALHYSKLRPERPLFFTAAQKLSADGLRKLGADSARLVKGVPFK